MSYSSKIRKCIQTVNYSLSPEFVRDAEADGYYPGRAKEVGEENALYFAKAIARHLESAKIEGVTLNPSLVETANSAVAKAVKI